MGDVIITIIGAIGLIIFFVSICIALLWFPFEGTETFQAIDERIAKWIKGADYDVGKVERNE